MRPKRILITGATGGLGRALVRAYAEPGVAFLLLGRDAEKLDAASKDAASGGAMAETSNLPVTDAAAMDACIKRFAADGGIDLLLLAAGVKTGNSGGVEPQDQLERVLAVNLSAPMLAVQSALPSMKENGRGQIALFSSLAALSPHADLLSYSASKGALRSYAVALRRCLRGTGVTVHLISPGFVDTPMTDRHKGPTPFLMSADHAARIIRRGLERGRPRISFPLRLVALIRLQNLLPATLGDAVDRRFRAQILPDPDESAARNKDNIDQ